MTTTTQATIKTTPHPPHSHQQNLASLNVSHSSPSRVTPTDSQKTPSSLCHSRGSSDLRSPSPDYFDLMAESKADSRIAGSRPIDNWSPFFLQSADSLPTKFCAMDSSSGLETFRKQVELNHGLNLNHSKLSLFSSSSIALPRSKLEKRTAKYESMDMPSPKLRQQVRNGMSIDIMNAGFRQEKELHISPRSITPAQKSEETTVADLTLEKTSTPRNAIHPSTQKHCSFPLQMPPNLRLPRSPKASPTASSSQLKNGANSLAQVRPSSAGDKPSTINPTHLREIIENCSEPDFLLLDLRVFPLYSKSHIKGALNLCIPTTLLKRPSFNLQKLNDTFSTEAEKTRFSRWITAKYIIVYDSLCSDKDAVSAFNTLKKFSTEGWTGTAYILQGGFQEFSKAHPTLIDQGASEATQSSKISLSLGVKTIDAAPVAGGCLLPTVQNAANPFFSNIRQNQDLIGGVGQIDLKLPEQFTPSSLNLLPKWLLKAAEVQDHGKKVSSKYLRLEQEELATMTKALSSGVSSGSPIMDPKIIKLAGIEKGEKNRYNNIWPYEHSRVKLQGRPTGACDYVNASHIKASRSNKRYIASQGPLPATFEDFWSVIWEQDVRVIVMLTAEVENGQLKCHSYWSSQTYGTYTLKLVSESKAFLETRIQRESSRRRANTVVEMTQFTRDAVTPSADIPHVTVRKFALSNTAHQSSPTREITQIHYSSWPDFGAPASPGQVLALVEITNILQRYATTPTQKPRLDEPEEENTHPILVHCSAGCGRTGTFCTIDSVIDMLKRQRNEVYSVPSGSSIPSRKLIDGVNGNWVWDGETDLVEQTVEDFRSQRLSMVQNLRQFVLCYETILEWISQQVMSDHKQSPTKSRVAPTSAAIALSGCRDRCGSVW